MWRDFYVWRNLGNVKRKGTEPLPYNRGFVNHPYRFALFSGRLHVRIGRYIPVDHTVCFFKCFYILSYQHKHLTVNASAFIIGNVRKLIQHFFFDSDRNTFDSHIITPKQIYYIFILDVLCVIMLQTDILYI